MHSFSYKAHVLIRLELNKIELTHLKSKEHETAVKQTNTNHNESELELKSNKLKYIKTNYLS